MTLRNLALIHLFTLPFHKCILTHFHTECIAAVSVDTTKDVIRDRVTDYSEPSGKYKVKTPL